MNIKETIICLKGIKKIGHDIFTEQRDFQECLDNAIDILEKIEKCDETSATRCFTCINEIKERYFNGNEM